MYMYRRRKKPKQLHLRIIYPEYFIYNVVCFSTTEVKRIVISDSLVIASIDV